ncbi:helix-turn-helix domain-containing protein [Streptomyces sp. ODS28]|uniref:PucR family transcriptional regulator n=1 Tax=Streptomyces sp. ODS28 TaxID=3136688 RepID=UPI0031F14865
MLRKELPSLAGRVAVELEQSIPALPAILKAQDIERDDLQWALEQALLSSLGYKRCGVSGGEAASQGDGRGPEGAVRAAPPALPLPAAALAPAVPIDRARRQLFTALIDERASSPLSLSELSRAARWPLPDTVRAVALASPCEVPQLAAALGNALVGPFDGEVCLLVPDPGEYEGTAALEGLLRGRRAAVGHVVPLNDAASSLRWARRLLEIAPEENEGAAGAGRGEARVQFVDDHLSRLLLLQDESLTRALAARWLAPLDGLTPRQSERLEVTLLAWLEGGGAPEAARTLQVHPQTVRYRLRQIEKLFGPSLRDPRTRFEMEMTLRGRRLLAEVRRRRSRAGRRARALVTGAGTLPLGVAHEARVNGL